MFFDHTDSSFISNEWMTTASTAGQFRFIPTLAHFFIMSCEKQNILCDYAMKNYLIKLINKSTKVRFPPTMLLFRAWNNNFVG